MSDNIKNVFIILILVVCVWVSVTTTINAFSNPAKTRTQLFLDIPKSFMLNFK